MNGPQHYQQAEALLANADHLRASVAMPGMTKEMYDGALAAAELDMKAAHVHAMLAVAAATYDATRNAPATGQEVVDPDDWGGGARMTDDTRHIVELRIIVDSAEIAADVAVKLHARVSEYEPEPLVAWAPLGSGLALSIATLAGSTRLYRDGMTIPHTPTPGTE